MVADLANSEGRKTAVARGAYEDMSVCVYADAERNDLGQTQAQDEKKGADGGIATKMKKGIGWYGGAVFDVGRGAPSGVTVDEEGDP